MGLDDIVDKLFGILFMLFVIRVALTIISFFANPLLAVLNFVLGLFISDPTNKTKTANNRACDRDRVNKVEGIEEIKEIRDIKPKENIRKVINIDDFKK